MEVNMEWNVCRICLQEGEMHAIFENEDDNTSVVISEKIMQCSSIIVRQGMNLPEQICAKCIADLEVAYKFRTNCESSEAILKSIIESTIPDLVINSDTGGIYTFRPPAGLNVRKIKTTNANTKPYTVAVKEEQISDNEEIESIVYNEDEKYDKETEVEYLEYDDDDDDVVDDDVHVIEIEEMEVLNLSRVDTSSAEAQIWSNHKIISINRNCPTPEMSTTTIVVPTSMEETVDIKTVKLNKIQLHQTAKPQIIQTQTVHGNPESTQLIRVKRVFNEPKPLKVCDICGNTYKYQNALESHMRRHRNEKPFECVVCGKGFVINFELSRHMRTHTGQKPYSCNYCDRSFSDFGSRIKHERTHTGERPYTCKTCGKTFAYSHVLSSHSLTHTGVKKYHCEKCGKRFTKSHHLKTHLNTHDKQMNPEPIAVQSITSKTKTIQPNLNEYTMM